MAKESPPISNDEFDLGDPPAQPLFITRNLLKKLKLKVTPEQLADMDLQQLSEDNIIPGKLRSQLKSVLLQHHNLISILEKIAAQSNSAYQTTLAILNRDKSRSLIKD